MFTRYNIDRERLNGKVGEYMKKQEYKRFAELYTNIIKEVSDEVGEPFSVVIKKLNGKEKLIRNEYEQRLIMDEQYYIDKFIRR